MQVKVAEKEKFMCYCKNNVDELEWSITSAKTKLEKKQDCRVKVIWIKRLKSLNHVDYFFPQDRKFEWCVRPTIQIHRSCAKDFLKCFYLIKKTVKKSSEVPACVKTLDCQKGDVGVNLSSAKLVLRRDSTFSVEQVFCFSAKTTGKGLEHQLHHI